MPGGLLRAGRPLGCFRIFVIITVMSLKPRPPVQKSIPNTPDLVSFFRPLQVNEVGIARAFGECKVGIPRVRWLRLWKCHAKALLSSKVGNL